MLRVAASRFAPLAPVVGRTMRPLAVRAMATFYTREHEYASIDGDVATCGISDHAQSQLGDVVYASLPDVGDEFKQGDTAASVESVKAASDVYAPLSGTVVEVNGALEDEPGLINDEAQGGGWFFKLKITDEGETKNLLTQDEYEKFVDEEEH
mmetsp:Transcript_21169/g.74658  ORF Transcript_21169/g.74658 Transcript_21169/m.74658 type:complete len:153 (-) Transcript_21169:32-490(-)